MKMKQMKIKPLILGMCMATSVVQAAGEETLSSPEKQTGVAITIYNENLALVKDVRQVPFKNGVNAIAWRGVSAQMRPETALLRDLKNGNDLTLLEQNFDFDLLTPGKLLDKYVGQKVRVIKTHPQTGAETVEEATVLAANNGVVLQFANRVETQPTGRIVYDAVPSTLRDKPTLVIQAQSEKDGQREVELSYLTGGLSWKADYVAELSADENNLALNGWVTLTNKSGAAYRNAKLQLVAGDVNQVQPVVASLMRGKAMVADAPAPISNVREESLLDYHLYTLPRTTTVGENQTKQVALLSAQKIPAQKEYRLMGDAHYYQDAYSDLGRKLKVAVNLSFRNQEPALGIPLPRGVIRVYKRDAEGHAQFVGEDQIDHTPKNEEIRLKLGDAFDVTASRKQTDFKRSDGAARRDMIFESAFEITLKNAKKEAVTVKLLEPIPGTWEILQESQKHQKDAANLATWSVSVPAEGSTVLTYRVRSRF